LGIGGVLAALFGSQALKTTSIVVVLLVVLAGVLLVIADRRRLKNKYNVHKELLARYCDFVIDRHADPLILIEEWKQMIYVQENGDTREVLTIKAKALRKQVYFIRFRTGCQWDQPMKYRRRVKLSARHLTVNGSSGPEWHVTRSWISDRKIQSIVHFHTPVLRGEEIALQVVRTWPGKCRPLMRKRIADSFTFHFTKLMPVKSMEFSVVLPAGFEAYHAPIGFREPSEKFSIEVGQDQESRRVFTFRGEGFPVLAAIGMRLQLK
jgi:hypothetical protein